MSHLVQGETAEGIGDEGPGRDPVSAARRVVRSTGLLDRIVQSLEGQQEPGKYPAVEAPRPPASDSCVSPTGSNYMQGYDENRMSERRSHVNWHTGLTLLVGRRTLRLRPWRTTPRRRLRGGGLAHDGRWRPPGAWAKEFLPRTKRVERFESM